MESLFKRLFRYRPTEGRQPKEDWFTESFAAVLDRQPGLGGAYAGRLIGRDVETADIETQRTFDIARPDMWIDARDAEGRRHVVMVEHKMGAPAERPQLEAYERRLRGLTAETKTLVHVAGSTEAPDFKVTDSSVRFECLRWFEVYRWLRCWAVSARNGGEAVQLVDELLRFMEERGMSIEIGMDELAAYTVCKASGVEQRLEQLLNAAWDDCGMTDALGETEGKVEVRREFGRLGVAQDRPARRERHLRVRFRERRSEMGRGHSAVAVGVCRDLVRVGQRPHAALPGGLEGTARVVAGELRVGLRDR